jgi:hypothetical protein
MNTLLHDSTQKLRQSKILCPVEKRNLKKTENEKGNSPSTLLNDVPVPKLYNERVKATLSSAIQSNERLCDWGG